MAGPDRKVNQVTLVFPVVLATLETLASMVILEQQDPLVTRVPLESLDSLDQPAALVPLVVPDFEDQQAALASLEPLVLMVALAQRVNQAIPVWMEDLATLVAQAPLDSLDKWALQVSKYFLRLKLLCILTIKNMPFKVC